MSTAVLDQRREERDQARNAALAMAEGENFDPESEDYQALVTRADKLDASCQSLAALLEQQQAADVLDGKIAKAQKAKETQTRSEQSGQLQTRETWGELFVRSEVFSGYHGRGTSAMFEVDNGLQTRALPTGLQDVIDQGFRVGPTVVDVQGPQVPTPILDNVTTVNVSGNSVEFVFWGVTPDSGAEVVAEKAVKPPSEWKPNVESTTLDTIAHYTQLTRQLIEDLPAVRSLIDNELRRGVLVKEEEEAAGVITAATDIPAVTGDDLLGAMRFGIGTVQAAGYNPNAVMLNPADYAALDIAVMGATNSGPAVGSGYWGLTPIPSRSQTEGTVLVGDFRTAVQHYVRSQVQLYITDSHADTFLANVFTLLAERRSKTAVVRPGALCSCSGPAPSPAVQSTRARKSAES